MHSRNHLFARLCGAMAMGFVLALAGRSALAAPSSARIYAEQPCTLVVSNQTTQTQVATNSLATLMDANDGHTWYGEAWQNIADRSFTAALTGYKTYWYTYSATPSSIRYNGPSQATKLMSSSPTVGITLAECEKYVPMAGTPGVTLLYARFTPVTYSVFYNLNGGAFPDAAEAPATATYDKAFTVTNPTREGYTFAGWKNSDGRSFAPTADVGSMELGNLTSEADGTARLTAQWTGKSYTLKLVVTEGIAKIHYRTSSDEEDWQTTTESCSVKVEIEKEWSAWAETEYGYALEGEGASEAAPMTGVMTAWGATYTPSASKESYLVTVRANPTEGGTVQVNADGRFTYGARAQIQANESTGWDFVAWEDVTTSERRRLSADSVYSLSVTNNVFLEAVFERETYSVTFVYRLESGDEYRDDQQVAYGASATEPATWKRNVWPGHTFTQWDSSAWQSVDKDMTVYAKYSDNAYTVHFSGNGASSGGTSDQTLTCGNATLLTANNYARTGYGFAGWCTDPTGDGTLYKNQEEVTDVTTSAEITFYAQWTPNTYTIRFEPGTGATGDAYAYTVNYDDVFTLPPCRFEHTVDFLGWYDSASGLTYAPGEDVTRLTATDGGTITLTAQWASDRQVRYHANYAGAREALGYDAYAQVFAADVEDALRANLFTRTGYTFANWTNSTGTVYANQGLVENPAAIGQTLELYATWEPITYQISFDANGGTGNRTPVTQVYDYLNVPSYKTDTIANPEGFSFRGWGTNTTEILIPKENSESGVNSTVSSSIALPGNLTTIPNDHICLYAIWEKTDPTVATSPYSEALGCSNLVFDSSAAAAWTICTNETTGAIALTNNYTAGEATLAATTKKSGTLTFQWQPSAVGDLLADYAVTAEVGEVDGGEVSITPASTDGTYESRSTVTFTAMPKEGYHFVSWSDGSTETNHAITVACATNLMATFAANLYPLKLVVGDGIASIDYGQKKNLSDKTTVRTTTTVEKAFGTSWYLQAAAKYGWTLAEDFAGQTKTTIGTAGRTYAPVATRQSFAVTVGSAEGAMGAASGSATSAPYESAVTCLATPSNGYHFVSWSDGATENPHDITVLAATNVTATFAANAYPLTLTLTTGVAKVHYKIGAGAWQATAKDLSVKVTYGETYAVWAEAAAGYTAQGEGWSEATAISGAMGVGGFAFTPNPLVRQFTVSTAVTPAGWGETHGDGQYAEGDSVTLTATPAEGYHLASWSDGATETNHTIVVTCATNLTATFAANLYRLSLKPGTGVAKIHYRTAPDADWKTATSAVSTTVTYGTTFAFYAEAQAGYTLDAAYAVTNNVTMTTAGYACTVTATKNRYEVTAVAEPTAGGTVTGAGTYEHGATATLTATANEGYDFTGWSDGVTAATRTLTVVAATNLTARFKAQMGTLKLVIADSDLISAIHYRIGGDWLSVSDAGTNEITVAVGTECELYAEAMEGYVLTGNFADYSAASPHSEPMTTAGIVFEPTAKSEFDVVMLMASAAPRPTRARAVTLLASAEETTEKPRDYMQAERLTGTTLAVCCGDTVLTNLTGAASYDAVGGTCRWETVTLAVPGAGEIKFVQDAGAFEGTAAKYPCLLANVRWTPDEEVKTGYGVTFTIDAAKGVRLGGGALAQTCYTNGVDTATKLYALEPTVVGVNGWDFAGWRDTVADTNLAANALADYAITNTTAFTARFEPHLFTVEYANTHDLNNANASTFVSTNGWVAPWGAAASAKTVTYGTLVNIDGTTNAAFMGWSSAALEPVNYPDGTALPYTNVVVQALWTNMVKEATVYYDVVFSSGEGGTTVTQSVEKGKNALAPAAAAKDGYIFTGWSSSIDKVTGARSVKAEYEVIKYPLTYTHLLGCTHTNPAEYDVEDVRSGDLKLLEPKNSNSALKFQGWTLDGTNVTALARDSTGAKTFVATWGYRVSYTGDEHLAFDGKRTATGHTLEGSVITNAPSMTLDAGYALAGWRVEGGEDGDLVALDKYTVTEPVALTAVTTACVYRITYAALDGATNAAENPSTFTVTNAVTFAAPGARTGYTFAGWTPAAIASGTTNDVTATATWTEDSEPEPVVKSYSITYVGLEGAANTNPTSFTATNAVTFVAPGARAGYTFTGWTPAAIAVGTTHDVTVTANWQKDPEPEPAFTGILVDVAAMQAAASANYVIAVTNAMVGTYLEWPVVVTNADVSKVTMTGLPSGLKFTAKAVTKTTRVNGVRVTVTNVPPMTIYGTPKAGGKTSTTKVTVKTTDKKTLRGVVQITVEALPTWLVATYTGGSTNAAAPGGASVTVAKTGKITGKWISGGKTWTLTGTGFTACADGAAEADVTAKSGKTTETVTLAFDTASGIARVRGLVDGEELFAAYGANWKVAPWKAVAKTLKGTTFTVVDGDATLTGKVASYGVVSVKGSFDVGATRPYTATVKATLVPFGDGTYALFVYYPPKTARKFAGYAAWLTL